MARVWDFSLLVSQKVSFSQFLECWKDPHDSGRDEGSFIKIVAVAFLCWFFEPAYPQKDQSGMKRLRLCC